MMLVAMLSHVFRAGGFVFAFLLEAVELLDEEPEDVAEEVAGFEKYLSMMLTMDLSWNFPYNLILNVLL